MINLKKSNVHGKFITLSLTFILFYSCSLKKDIANHSNNRERISLNEGWKFYKYETELKNDSLIYDIRPDVIEDIDGKAADARPTDALKIEQTKSVLKPWILPTGNDYIKDKNKKYQRPSGNPGEDFPFVQKGFNDANWDDINLPHDWAIKGPFYEGYPALIGGGMGRLPIQGVAWYRKKIEFSAADAGKSIYLDVDGAMSYAMVWVNGKLSGGWPYGYNSWRVDLTPYLNFGGENQIAIRLDNPISSSRWYPGAGIYRNVWLTKTNAVQVAQWGTFISTTEVSKKSANINLKTTILNQSKQTVKALASTQVFSLDKEGQKIGNAVSTFDSEYINISAGESGDVNSSTHLASPKLWGPPPTQQPNRYIAVTTIKVDDNVKDVYETPFGIRELNFNPDKGIFVNGEKITIKGVDMHHDLGALGAAFNVRAAERQLQMLQGMGCNAIRMSHNPPAPELLDLTDEMGFLVIDEVYDTWVQKKTPLDFHLIFPDWHEQDLRALIRRDKNHPSVILWSFGNEVGEQYTGEKGAEVARMLKVITKDEDPTRLTTIAMNYAKPDMPLPEVADVISLNYQGEGIRNGGAYAGLKGINTPPLFPAFHTKFPDKLILSSENAAALSSRGEYMFPVFEGNSSPVKDGQGGDSKTHHVSAYELYSVDFGSSADKVFATLDQHPYVAGGFVWSGWDYLGEPTPYYTSRSSYFGVIDLAGFKKDRFYLYQSYWRPELPMAHILPHWNWSDRLGLVTPVHVFTSGDEAELFLNGKSLGRKKKGEFEYRLSWDDVKYKPGELKVIAYKNGKQWAEDVVKTTQKANNLNLEADQAIIGNNGKDLSFITLKIADVNGNTIPNANQRIKFSIEGPGEIVATDNGDPTDLTSFASLSRNVFNGFCLVIVRSKIGESGEIKIKAESDNLISDSIIVQSVK